MDTIIRREESKDIDQIRAILLAAFPTDAESKLVDALRASGRAVLSLVADNHDRILGHILFSPVSTTPPNEARGIGLAPVAVHPDVQAQGIGSKLIREGLRISKALSYDYCVVLGNPDYYQRFGFETASKFDLENEYGVDHEFMVIRLSEHELPRGVVRYATEFGPFSV